MPAISDHPEGATIAIQAQPRSSRTGIQSVDQERVKLRVAAPPVDGAANQEIVAWLAKQLRVPKSGLSILQGEHGRQKVILVPGLSGDEVRARLGLV